MTMQPRLAAEPPPIFIIGDGRSGTTLLRMMISAHPNIYICHESWFYIWEDVCPSKYDSAAFLRAYSRTAAFRWFRLDVEAVIGSLSSMAYREEAHHAFEYMMKQKALQNGRRRYGDKTPTHSLTLPRIFTDFPDAKVIQMVRDPRAEVLSISQLPFGTESEYLNSIIYAKNHSLTEPFAGRILRVKLEDLLADPRQQMQRILDYVGEEWDDAVLDHASHRADPHDMPVEPWFAMAERPIVQGAAPTWENAPPVVIRLIEDVCAEAMAVYGYEPAAMAQGVSKASVYRMKVSQVPEILRIWQVQARTGRLLRSPDKWETPPHRKLFQLVNRRWWRKNPDYHRPEPPTEAESATVAGTAPQET